MTLTKPQRTALAAVYACGFLNARMLARRNRPRMGRGCAVESRLLRRLCDMGLLEAKPREGIYGHGNAATQHYRLAPAGAVALGIIRG